MIPALGAGGPGFKSRLSPQSFLKVFVEVNCDIYILLSDHSSIHYFYTTNYDYVGFHILWP